MKSGRDKSKKNIGIILAITGAVIVLAVIYFTVFENEALKLIRGNNADELTSVNVNENTTQISNGAGQTNGDFGDGSQNDVLSGEGKTGIEATPTAQIGDTEPDPSESLSPAFSKNDAETSALSSQINDDKELVDVEQIVEQTDVKQTNETNMWQEEPGILPSSGGEPGNTMSNLINGAIAADGIYEYVMVSNIYGQHNLLKINSSTGEYQKLTDNRGFFINIAGDWIYFVERVEDDPYYGGIVRLRKDGSYKEELFSGSSRHMVVIGKTIYFINGSDDFKIYSMDTNGKNLKRFIDKKASQLQYYDGYLYFTSFYGTTDLYRINTLNAEQVEKIAENVEKYVVDRNSIYYLTFNSRQLYKKNVGETDSMIIHNNIEFIYLVANDKIYFMTEERGDIYTMDLNGENIVLLPKGKYEPIRRLHGIVGDTVYYWVIFDDLEAASDELARMRLDGTMNELISENIFH